MIFCFQYSTCIGIIGVRVAYIQGVKGTEYLCTKSDGNLGVKDLAFSE